MNVKKFRAWFGSMATSTVEFEYDTDLLPEDPDERRSDLEEAAYRAFPGASICHHCSRDLDLSGDWEIGTGEDDIQELGS